MAEIRPVASPAANLPAAPRGSARTEAVRTAQAAFFQAALTGSPAATPAAAAARPATQPAPVNGFDPDAPAPTRILRPGSLVDLKV